MYAPYAPEKVCMLFIECILYLLFRCRKNKKTFDIGPTYRDMSLTSIGTSYLEFNDDQVLLTYTTNHT